MTPLLFFSWLALAAPQPAAAEAPGATQTGGSPTLVGTWRFDMVIMTRAHVPVLGDTVVETHKVMIARFSEEGDGGLRAWHTACGMHARSSRRLARTWFPQSFVDALADQTYPVEVEQHADALPTIRAHVEPVRLGWDPAISGGSMPHEADEAGVVDVDHDGHPGVTLYVQAPIFGDVRVYVVQGSETWIEGRFETPDRITGSARLVDLDQRVLGASNPLFTSNVPITPDDGGSWFTMQRVPEGTTCTTLDAVAASPAGSPAAQDGSG